MGSVMDKVRKLRAKTIADFMRPITKEHFSNPWVITKGLYPTLVEWPNLLISPSGKGSQRLYLGMRLS